MRLENTYDLQEGHSYVGVCHLWEAPWFHFQRSCIFHMAAALFCCEGPWHFPSVESDWIFIHGWTYPFMRSSNMHCRLLRFIHLNIQWHNEKLHDAGIVNNHRDLFCSPYLIKKKTEYAKCVHFPRFFLLFHCHRSTLSALQASSIHITLVFAEYWTRIGSHTVCDNHKLCLWALILKSDFQWAERKCTLSAMKVGKKGQTLNCGNKKKNMLTQGGFQIVRLQYQYQTWFYPKMCLIIRCDKVLSYEVLHMSMSYFERSLQIL